jgi:hypothetical protein
MNVTLIDTSVATDNLGDEIIMHACEGIVRDLFPQAYVSRVASHEYMSHISRDLVETSEVAIVCGTNLLSSRMRTIHKWRIRSRDVSSFGNAVLLGVGWGEYENKANTYTRWLLGRVLSPNYLQATRDSYTITRLKGIDRRFINTACPTMWALTPEHCKTIPATKAEDAVVTLNSWQADREGDSALFKLLAGHYKNVFYWPQTREDVAYFEELNPKGVKRVAPQLRTYDSFLRNESVDFIGLRLHAGIRSLQRSRRTLIVAIDNRATEISKDTNLPVVARGDLKAIESWITTSSPTKIQLPEAAIASWKQQLQ